MKSNITNKKFVGRVEKVGFATTWTVLNFHVVYVDLSNESTEGIKMFVLDIFGNF